MVGDEETSFFSLLLCHNDLFNRIAPIVLNAALWCPIFNEKGFASGIVNPVTLVLKGRLEKGDGFLDGRVDSGGREIDGAQERTEMLLKAPGHGVNMLPFKGKFIAVRLVDQILSHVC